MIYIGSIGWEYKDWQESIYKNVPFDKWLLVYCKFFNYLEINKTYNELVDKNYFQNLAKLTERKLKIGFRLNKAVTHLNINKSSISENLVIAENIANQFSDLVSENWFGPIIIDFPFSFYFNKNNFSKVIAICECFENYKKTIEFSNKEWINDEVIDYLSTNKIAVCLRDVPKFDNLADDLNFLITSDFSYIKFYGKNQENWWQPLTEEDRTHYLYNQKILTKWFKNINEKLINNIEDLFIVFNNVKEGNAILNSEYLRKKLLVKPAIDNYQLELPL